MEVHYDCEHYFRGIQRLFSWKICSEGLNRLRYSDLIAVKTRAFFGETSPQTYVNRGLINSCLFWMAQICRLECKIRPDSIFGELSVARNFGGHDSVPLNFLKPKFSGKTPISPTFVSLAFTNMPLKKL